MSLELQETDTSSTVNLVIDQADNDLPDHPETTGTGFSMATITSAANARTTSTATRMTADDRVTNGWSISRIFKASWQTLFMMLVGQIAIVALALSLRLSLGLDFIDPPVDVEPVVQRLLDLYTEKYERRLDDLEYEIQSTRISLGVVIHNLNDALMEMEYDRRRINDLEIANELLSNDLDWILVQKHNFIRKWVTCSMLKAHRSTRMNISSISANDKFATSTWADYRRGFGRREEDAFWLGLEQMHKLTRKGHWKLKIAIRYDKSKFPGLPETDDDDYAGSWGVDELKRFHVGSEETNFTLTLSGQGHSINRKWDDIEDIFGVEFSTPDRDSESRCAARGSGGWWFKESRTDCFGHPFRGTRFGCLNCHWRGTNESWVVWDHFHPAESRMWIKRTMV